MPIAMSAHPTLSPPPNSNRSCWGTGAVAAIQLGPARPNRGQRFTQTLLLSGAMAMAGSHATAQPPSADPVGQWTAQAQSWLNEQLRNVDPSTPNSPRLRPEVEFGELDSRLRLAPCLQVTPYLPAGTRLWGRSRIGLRCDDGPVRWNVFLPVTVRVWGPAWVIRKPLAPDTTLNLEDAELAEVDWTESTASVLARTQDWVGSQTSRALMPGQALRQGMVRPPQAFSAGSQVKVTIQGAGFSMAATGEALTHGFLGQSARVRMPNRKVISGIVRDAETVEVSR